MNLGVFLFFIFSILCFFGLIAALISLIPNRKDTIVKALIFYIDLVIWLIVTSVAEVVAPVGSATVFFAKLQFIGFLFIPVAWITFCLSFTSWVKEKKQAISLHALIVPGILFLFVLTNEYHGLVWRDLQFIEIGDFSILKASFGPLFWIMTLYIWGTLFAGILIVLTSFLSGQRVFFRQSLWILIGMLLPGMVYLVYVFEIIPVLTVNYTPIAFALTGFCFVFCSYFQRLFWIMPVARGAVLEEIKIGFLVIDKNGRIVDHNKAASVLLELDPVSVGKSVKNYPSLMEVLDLLSHSQLGSTPTYSSEEFEWKGKTISIFRTPISRVSFEGIVLLLEDVSEKKVIQQQVQQLKEEIVNQAQFVKLGRIAAGLAHEIRNPLGYMKSDFRSLEKILSGFELSSLNKSGELVWKEIQDILRGIDEGITRIEHVLTSLLSLTRKKKGEEPFVDYNLHEGIETTLLLLQPEYRSILRIQREYGEVPIIKARKNAINQVLFNILANAIEAIHLQAIKSEEPRKKHGAIIIRTGVGQGYIVCEIANTGPPIPDEEKELIFDPFFTTKQASEKGTGIGLYLAKEIVEKQHHGKLELVSQNPVTFRIVLPLNPEAQDLNSNM